MYKSWVGSKEESNLLFIWGIFVKLTCWNFQAEHLKWANYQSNTESVWHLDKCSRTEVMLVYSPISPCLVIGLEWILRMSRRACSLGSSMSEEETKESGFPAWAHIELTEKLNRRSLTNFAVQSARPQQGRVESVRSVGGHDHLDSVQCVEAVHLIQQLKTHRHVMYSVWLSTCPLQRQPCYWWLQESS